MKDKGMLYFFCGKMGAGKTTYAKKLSEEINALYLSEDDWLTELFPGEIKDFNDYLSYSQRIKPFLEKHILSLINCGVSVVMDFPGNTKKQRTWFSSLIDITKANHQLIYLKVSDDICLKQIDKRREEFPERNSFDTEEVFHHVTSFFQEPTKAEGFNLKIVK